MTSRRGVLALLSTLPLIGRARATTGRRILVIGAGMAGLAAARSFHDAGHAVTVIEARDRIGGRIWTQRTWPGLPVDLGASWIHGANGNPITSLARTAKAPTLATSYDSGLAFTDGEEADDLPDPSDLLAAAQDAAFDAPKDLSLQAAIDALPDWQALAPADRAALRAALYRDIELEYAADAAILSARHFDAGEGFDGPDLLFPQGYDAIPRHVARGLGIRLNATVRAVTATAEGVSVTLADGSRTTADAAICTLPLGVLQSGRVTFDPPLSPTRQTAIDTLGMGLLNKIWLRFDAPPPVPDADWLTNRNAPTDLWPEWVNLRGTPLLLGFNAASRAAGMESWTDADTTASATDSLRAMFGTAFPAPRAAIVTRWRADPFALGSYSYAATGTTPDTRAALAGADWDDRLIFAGEATSTDHPSTVHGAWLSGLDAAAALSDL